MTSRAITEESRAYRREYMRRYREKHGPELRERESARRKAARQQDGGAYNSYMSTYRRAPEKIPKRLWGEARYRARQRNLEFSIDVEDVILPECCPIFGVELLSMANGGGPGDNSPTLDRIDPAKGYVKGNVWVISGRANRIKNNATLDELQRLVRALERKTGKA